MKTNQNKVRFILAILKRRMWLIIIPFIFTSVASYVSLRFITPLFESNVIVSVNRQYMLSRDMQRMLLEGMQSRQRRVDDLWLETQSILAELRSSSYISQLIQRINLDKDPFFGPEIREGRGRNPNLPHDQIQFNILWSHLREHLKVRFIGTDMVRITCSSPNPYTSKNIAQILAEIFISEKTKQELGLIRLSQDFSYNQLAKYEKDLEEKVDNKTRIENELARIQLDEVIISEENRRNIILEFEGTKNEISDLEKRQRSLAKQLPQIPEGIVNIADFPSITNLKNEIKQQLSSLTNLVQKYGWKDPEILNYKTRFYTKVEELESEISQLVYSQYVTFSDDDKRIIDEYYKIESRLDILYLEEQYFSLALDALNERANLVLDYQTRIEQLTREINIARDFVLGFRQQEESSEISQALLREAKYGIVEPAKLPTSPSSPDKRKVILLGIILGLVIGGGIVVLIELLDDSIRDIEDVEILGMEVLAVVPKMGWINKIKT